MVASCRPSSNARSTASRLTTPPSFRPLPSGSGSEGSVNSTVGPCAPVESRDWNSDAHRDHDQRQLQERDVRACPGSVAAPGRDHEAGDRHDQQQGHRVLGPARGRRRPIAHSHQAPGCRLRGKVGRCSGRIVVGWSRAATAQALLLRRLSATAPPPMTTTAPGAAASGQEKPPSESEAAGDVVRGRLRGTSKATGCSFAAAGSSHRHRACLHR